MAVNNIRVMPYNFVTGVTCGTEDANNPAANLLTDNRFQRFNTSADFTHFLSFDFGGDLKRIRCIALNHKMLPDENITINLFKNNTEDAADKVYDGSAHHLMDQNTDAGWHSTELTSDYLIDDYNTTSDKLYLNFDADISATNGIIIFNLNTSTIVDADYLYVGNYLESDDNIYSGYSSFYSHIVDEQLNSAGDSFFNDGAKFNNIIVNWDLLTEHERQRFKLFSKNIGRNKKIIISIHPEDNTYKRTVDSILGTVQNDIEIIRNEDYQDNIYSTSIHVRAPID